MFSRRSLSFDGKLFFLYDREAVTSERDPPENAIIYFYPSSASIENRVSICGQLVGMSNFLTTVLDFAPVLINLKTEKVALCQSGQYTLALGGSMNEPETLLIRQLQNVFDVFVFYHGSLDTVRKLSKDHAVFLTNMSIIWDCYMHFIRNYGDTLPAVFNPLPFLKTPKNSSGCFLKASHILQACQRRHHILGGCILHQKSVLCTQLETNITKRLLLLKPNQSHHPGKQVKTEIQLPFGVRFLDSFVTCCEYERLIKALQKSPYQNSTKRSKPRPSSDSPKQQQSKSKTTAHQSAQENPNLQSTSKPTTDESAKDSSDLKLNIKPTSESAKGSSDLKSTSELRASESAKDSSDIKLRVSPTTSESAIERSDLQSTSELTTNESLDSLDDKESSDLKPTSKLTTGESAKENMDSKQLTNSGTEKRSKVVKTQSINTDNGSTKKGELCHPHKSNESKLDSNDRESERSLNGKRKDEINENDCTVDDSTSDGMLNGNSLESSTDSFDQCTDKIVNQYPKENDINDDDKEPLLQGTDLTMDEIDISGLRIVNGNSTRSCRDINKKVINDQDFHDPFRDINDQAVMDHDFCGPNRDINDQAVLDHDVLDLSRNMNSEAITDKDFVGPSKDLDVEVIRDEHAPQNEEVLICGELINSLIEQVINQCEDNANCGTACGVSVSKEISLSLSKKCEVGDQITCGSANCALRENDKVAEELLQLANDVDINAHNISTEDDYYCDSAENAEGLDTSHQARSPPIDLPGLCSHGDQGNRFSNPHVHESLCSPNEEFHDTVEEFDSEMKFTPRTVNAFMNSYHGLKSNVSMTGKYSDLNLNHPCDKAMDKSFFNDLIVSDKLETTIGNDHCSGDIPSRSASSISQGTESHRSEGSGRESGFSHSISSESPTHRCTVDCQTNLGDSGLCLFHGSSESSLSQVDGASESLLSQVDGASESSLSQVDGASESSLSQVDGASESSLSQVDGASNNPDMQQESPVESEHSSTSTTDLEMSTTTVTGDVEEKQKEQAEYVDEFDENLYQIDGLVHINLYVQAHSNTVLILLADPSLSQDQETIKALWKTTLNELGELEVHLNQCSKTDAERRDKPDDYSFVVYDVISCTTKGNLTEPVEQVDFKFCDTAKTVHEQFNNCTSLKSVTLRDNSSAVHCQRSLGQEVYFHKKGSLKPFRGSPSTRDSTFSLERRAPKHLKKDYGVNII